jgi:hypothetical protein
MPLFEVLPGLPPYGHSPTPFPGSGYGAHRQGFVVRFNGDAADSWVGNFQPGLNNFSGAFVHPDGKRVVVVSGGNIYIVDPQTKIAEESGGMVRSVIPIPEMNALLLDEDIYLSLIRVGGGWQTKRLSWDGIRNLAVASGFATGEGWRYDDTWHQFSVSLETGQLSGGAYDGPDY